MCDAANPTLPTKVCFPGECLTYMVSGNEVVEVRCFHAHDSHSFAGKLVEQLQVAFLFYLSILAHAEEEIMQHAVRQYVAAC